MKPDEPKTCEHVWQLLADGRLMCFECDQLATLKDTREFLQMTQAEIAKRLCTAPNTWARWERGALPTPEMVYYALRALVLERSIRC